MPFVFFQRRISHVFQEYEFKDAVQDFGIDGNAEVEVRPRGAPGVLHRQRMRRASVDVAVCVYALI